MSAGDGAGFSIDPTTVRAWKRYPKYTDSGVAWLGEVPEHWGVKRFKYSVILKSKKISGQETDLPYVGLENIEPWTGQFIQPGEPLLSDGQSTLFNSGDVLFGKLRPYLAKALRAQAPGICSSEFLVLRPVDVTSDFLANYILNRDFIQAVDASTYGTKMPRANWEFIGNLPMLIPPLPEQHAIAAFLDRETARIDALIAKKQRFIELLEEKRQALITQAVTKGLDPEAEMRDSGVAWLGEVPAGWEVVKTKYVASLHSGHTPSRSHPEYWENCTIPWFSLADVWQLRDGRREYLGETKEKISRSGLANSAAELLPAGTVIVSRTASVGFSGIMPKPMATTQDYVNWVCDHTKILPEYLLYVFRSMGPEFKRLMMGSTHKTIYMPDVATFQTPLPPLDEQRHIVVYIRKRKFILDQVEDKSIASVNKLHEYRTALISAAVTGKIDVRGEIPADP
jgi:type I restriction enzyme S subunit